MVTSGKRNDEKIQNTHTTNWRSTFQSDLDQATQSRVSLLERVKRLVWFLGLALVVLLLLRLLLVAIGVENTNLYTSIIYTLSEPFVSPFYALFRSSVQYGQSRLDIETIAAILIYYLLTMAVLYFLYLSQKETVADGENNSNDRPTSP